ncbi:MAG: hypothetical protein WCX61_02290 [Candidatus Peribacteraceae bacterium]|jgi:hypothetical protein
MTKKPRPGEFVSSSDTTIPLEIPQFFSFTPQESKTLAENYRTIAVQMENQPKTILYPCCETDVTPSLAFPGAAVQYVDMNRQAIETLVAHGYDAHVGRVPTGRIQGQSSSDASDTPVFIPKNHVDLLILLNPQISPFAIAEYVRHQGYVLCNNYHQTANEMHTLNDFTPVAVLHTGENQELDTSFLGEYFRLLSTDEEYRQADPERYRIIQRYVYGKIRMLFPGLFDVSHAIPQFLECARGQHEMFDTVFIGKHALPKPLRQKSSAADDLFLFQRKKNSPSQVPRSSIGHR